MAYNSYFPASYQPMYYQPQYQPAQPQPVQQVPQAQPVQTVQSAGQNSGLIWVQGEAGAKSYLVAPNTTVMLMDSETQKFYLKSADASGMPLPLRTFDYKEVTEGSQTAPGAPKAMQPINDMEYVSKSEFEAFKGQIEAFMAKEAKDE